MEGIVEEKIRDADSYSEYLRCCDEVRKLSTGGDSDRDHRMSVDEDEDEDEDEDSDSDSDFEVVDLKGFCLGVDIEPHQWRVYYRFGLCGRLALYCYNSQKGTDYKFESLRKFYTKFGSFTKLFIKLEAMIPDENIPLTFKTVVNHADRRTEGGMLWWETCVCRVKGSEEEVDHEWNNEAIDDWYKGEMPKWLSDVEQQQCYVVQRSELHYNKWWLHLFTEIAFYTKWFGTLRPRDLADCLPLETQKVVVETREEAATEPRDKLKAANAIFYISFECHDDPLTGEKANYRAVIRKTMDGKPGHVRLELFMVSTIHPHDLISQIFIHTLSPMSVFILTFGLCIYDFTNMPLYFDIELKVEYITIPPISDDVYQYYFETMEENIKVKLVSILKSRLDSDVQVCLILLVPGKDGRQKRDVFVANLAL